MDHWGNDTSGEDLHPLHTRIPAKVKLLVYCGGARKRVGAGAFPSKQRPPRPRKRHVVPPGRAWFPARSQDAKLPRPCGKRRPGLRPLINVVNMAADVVLSRCFCAQSFLYPDCPAPDCPRRLRYPVATRRRDRNLHISQGVSA